MNNDLVFNYYGGTLESYVRQELNKKFDTVSIVVPGAAPDAFVGVDALEYILYEITKFKKVNFDQNFGRMSLPSDAMSNYVYEAVNNINRFFNTLLPEKEFKQKSNVSYSLNKSLNSFKIPKISDFPELALPRLIDENIYNSLGDPGRSIITNTSYIQVKVKQGSNVAEFAAENPGYLDGIDYKRAFLDGAPINLSPEDALGREASCFIYKILEFYLDNDFVSEADRGVNLDSAFNRLLNENFEFYLTTEFFATFEIASLDPGLPQNNLYKDTANKLYVVRGSDDIFEASKNASFVRLAHHKQLFIPKLLDSEGPIGSSDTSMIIEYGTKTVDGEVTKIGDITDDLHKEFASKFMSKDSNINFVKEQISKNVSLIELLSYVSLSNIFNARTIYFSEEFKERDKKEKDFKEARGELTKELNHFVDSIADNIKGTLRSATIQ